MKVFSVKEKIQSIREFEKKEKSDIDWSKANCAMASWLKMTCQKIKNRLYKDFWLRINYV